MDPPTFLGSSPPAVPPSAGSAPGAAPARRTPVIDTHVHCFAGPEDARFPYHVRAPYQPGEVAPPEHLLRLMAEAGVDHAVVVHPEPYQDDHRYLEHCLEVGKRKLKGTCLFFADRPGSLERMAELVKRREGQVVAARITPTPPTSCRPSGSPSCGRCGSRPGTSGWRS